MTTDEGTLPPPGGFTGDEFLDGYIWGEAKRKRRNDRTLILDVTDRPEPVFREVWWRLSRAGLEVEEREVEGRGGPATLLFITFDHPEPIKGIPRSRNDRRISGEEPDEFLDGYFCAVLEERNDRFFVKGDGMKTGSLPYLADQGVRVGVTPRKREPFLDPKTSRKSGHVRRFYAYLHGRKGDDELPAKAWLAAGFVDPLKVFLQDGVNRVPLMFVRDETPEIIDRLFVERGLLRSQRTDDELHVEITGIVGAALARRGSVDEIPDAYFSGKRLARDLMNLDVPVEEVWGSLHEAGTVLGLDLPSPEEVSLGGGDLLELLGSASEEAGEKGHRSQAPSKETQLLKLVDNVALTPELYADLEAAACKVGEPNLAKTKLYDVIKAVPGRYPLDQVFGDLRKGLPPDRNRDLKAEVREGRKRLEGVDPNVPPHLQLKPVLDRLIEAHEASPSMTEKLDEEARDLMKELEDWAARG